MDRVASVMTVARSQGKYITVKTNSLLNHNITGTELFLSRYPEVLSGGEAMSEFSSSFRKDLGDCRRLRRWSRGHVFIVQSCGHIDTWRPIYK